MTVVRWMRVIVASGVLVLGVTLLAALSPSAAAASNVHSMPSIVCPGSAGLATPPCCGPINAGSVSRAVTCCPVPTTAGCCTAASGTNCCTAASATTCCTSTPCPAATLSIAVSPNQVSEGSAVTITGTLTGATVASQTVDLFEKPAGQATFSDVAQTQTSATGAYQFARNVETNAQWYATVGSVQSATVSQSVLAAIVLHTSSARPKPGAKVMLSGTVAPSHAGERVALQRLTAGHWVTVARPKLDAQSRFAIAEKLRASASARFRVVLAADARNVRSVSGTVAIKAR